MREYTVNSLTKRVTLCKTANSFDDERNLIRNIVPWRSVWACVEEKRASIEQTLTGQRPVIVYVITIRKTDVSEVKTVMYNGKTLEMQTPIFLENPACGQAFMQFEAVETDGTVVR